MTRFAKRVAARLGLATAIASVVLFVLALTSVVCCPS